MNFGEFHFNNVRTDTDNVLIADVTLPDGDIEKGRTINSDLYKNMKFYNETRKLDTTLFDKISFPTFKLLIENQ
ncbi:hypothetical protein IGU62_002093 [Escherichia coli]|uniref:hypothetical protein n=1 Tax=Escherichia coli TaxID=562 RepID=UPI000DA5428D|nr:hypothetical protein [Escherichia coli]EFL9654793.1 hypothetical protein [Escherichia coli]EGL8705587.1 hypothetical protein [Escherichia coli]EIP3499168.1 hypothetical protein [Escherichia coli]EKH9549079.1 hypothetical protein [Escherichia coli]NJU52073.1 hypothetical protein [Escherichia coli]